MSEKLIEAIATEIVWWLVENRGHSDEGRERYDTLNVIKGIIRDWAGKQ